MNDFEKIIGMEPILEHLKNAVRLGKVSHAYIFNGEEKSGKKTVARRFAATLQCEKGGEEPCMVCKSCHQIKTGNHPDVVWVSHEKPNTIGVDDIRNQVVNDIVLKPYMGPYKIYIISEADKMTPQAQNALLKTIEEPPEYAVLLLLTENEERLLPTITSRCVTLNMKPVSKEVVKKYLMEEYRIPDYRAEVCVAFAQGNVGKAIMLATAENFERIKNETLHLVKTLPSMQAYEVSDAIKGIVDFKLNVNDYLDIMMVWYRDVLMYKATNDVNNLIFKDEINEIIHQANNSSYIGIENIIKGIEKSKERIKANVNFDLIMELLLMTIKES